MRSSTAMFLRASIARRIPERITEKVLSKQTEFLVNPFGLLQLRVSDCSPKIVGLDHNLYPNNDHVVVSHCSGCDVNKHQVDFIPTKGEDPKVLSISCTNAEHAEYCGCTIQVPNHMSLDISANGDSDVKISSVEPAECHISSEYSSIHLHKIKTRKASVFANNGSVDVTGFLTGNVSIKTGVSGFVRADRLQGNSVKIDTFEGPIKCKAIYAENVQLSSRQGNIHVKNLQAKETKIWSTQGNVDIGSMEGSLTASLGQGNLSANISQTEKIKVECLEGNASLGLNESLSGNIHLESSLPINNDNLPSSLEKQGHKSDGGLERTVYSASLNGDNSNSSEISVIARKGRINLQRTSWLDSLNLKQIDANGYQDLKLKI